MNEREGDQMSGLEYTGFLRCGMVLCIRMSSGQGMMLLVVDFQIRDVFNLPTRGPTTLGGPTTFIVFVVKICRPELSISEL